MAGLKLHNKNNNNKSRKYYNDIKIAHNHGVCQTITVTFIIETTKVKNNLI